MKKRFLKKSAAITLTAVLAASLAGCGSSGKDSQTAAQMKEQAVSQPGAGEAPAQGENGTEEKAAQEKASGEAAPGETVTVSFWMAAASEERNAFMEEIFKKFHEQNPNITVEYLGVPGDVAQFNQKVDMALAGNEAPDIIQGTLTAGYITRGIPAKLDEMYANSELKDRIDEKYTDAFRVADYVNGNLYAVPGPMNIQMIYTRPDYIAEAGLEAYQTWDDFFNIAKKTTKADEGIFGYIIRGGSGGAEALEKLMYSYSGITEYFVDGVCTLNDPKNVEFVEKYLGGYKKVSSADDLNKSWTEMSSQFQSGKAVMLVHNTGSGQANLDAFLGDQTKVAACPYPASTYTGKITVPDATLNGYMITESSKNKEAAWKVIEYLESPEIAGEYARLTGQIPAPSDAQSQAWIQESPYMKVASDYINDADTVMTHTPAYLPDYTTIRNDYAQPAMQEVMLGMTTAQEFLDEWARLLQEDYDELMK